MLLNGDAPRRNGNVTYSVNRPLLVSGFIYNSITTNRNRYEPNSSYICSNLADHRHSVGIVTESKVKGKVLNVECSEVQ